MYIYLMEGSPPNFDSVCHSHDISLKPVIHGNRKEPTYTYSESERKLVYTYANVYVETPFHICGRSKPIHQQGSLEVGKVKRLAVL